jgi:hypothetical protein
LMEMMGGMKGLACAEIRNWASEAAFISQPGQNKLQCF